MVLDIDKAALVRHTATLERIGKADLPVVVRQTLNKTAYDLKTITMPRSAMRFIQRNKTFFKSNSAVEQAIGFNINAMRSVVGFRPKQNDRSHSVEDLAAQEHGGTINNRAFVALAQARTGGKWARMVKTEAFMQRILPHIIDSNKIQGSTPQVRFTKAAVKAGIGGFVLGNGVNTGGNRILFLIQGLMRVGGNFAVKALPLFAVKKGRTVRPKASHFMETASVQSAQKLELFFKELAEQRIGHHPG